MSSSREASKKQGKESSDGSLKRSLGSQDNMESGEYRGQHKAACSEGEEGINSEGGENVEKHLLCNIIGPNHCKEDRHSASCERLGH